MDCFKCTEEIRFRWGPGRASPARTPCRPPVRSPRSYNFSTFSLANRALQSSIKVSLRIDFDGFMSLQLMMPQPTNKKVAPTESGIIEFKLRALEEEG